MASHNYYNNYTDSRPYDQHGDLSYHGATGLGKDTPLSANPSESAHYQSPTSTAQYSHQSPTSTAPYSHQSPFSTPFDDDQRSYHTYNESTQALNRPYSYADSGHHDPFGDRNAIPLKTKFGKGPYGPDGADSPTTAMANAERFGGAADDRSKEVVSRRRDKWFKNIPYAVYLLSSVQLIVFIVEIIKNGTLKVHCPNNANIC